jgi:hypothetical protein
MIGTGRNGSKLLTEILSLGTNISKFGEVGEGPYPEFYKLAYEGTLKHKAIKTIWLNYRLERMKESKEIYLEKNHLIVPILNTVNECFPNSKFIRLRRDHDETFRSFMNRPTYEESELSGSYGRGRLIPRKNSAYYANWDKKNKGVKVEWLINEYDDMCDNFLIRISSNRYRSVWYRNKIFDIHVMKSLYEWIGIKGYDEEKIKEIMKIQLGTSTDEKINGKLPNGRIRK